MDKMIKDFDSEIKGIDEKEGTMTAVISTGGVDRMRESLDPDGVDLRQYKKNPVVLWAHDYTIPPIGKALWTKREGNGIVSKFKFASTEFAQEIFQLYKEGIMKAFSVGFIPKQVEHVEDEENNPKKPRRIYKSWELLEFSAVPVPANPEALALAYTKGLIKSEAVKKAFEVKEEEPMREFNNEEPKTVFTSNSGASFTSNSGTATIKVKMEHIENPLEEIIAENKGMFETIKNLQKENGELKFKLYELLKEKQECLSEITASHVVKQIEDVTRRVIRQAQGKLD